MRCRLVSFCAVLGAAVFILRVEVVHGQKLTTYIASSKFGHAVQVVEVTDEDKYTLNEKGLEQVLMREDVKDLPVVVVSVAGAYRKGKSFLLNFFLRYLTSGPWARADGSWLGDDSEPLKGFSWSVGSTRNTTGILLWSEPFISSLPSGEKVAVLLMDTQGMFDSSSTVRECTTIFALSTLLSSVQIYNIAQNIQEDDLHNLQLFTEYGKLVQDQSSKPFQVLEFLVRDWPYMWEHPYGSAGGEQLLADRLRVGRNVVGELKDVREHIRSSFDKVSCYLMPHPGFAVNNPNYKGEIKELLPEFRQHLNQFASSIFSPAQLVPKLINNEKIKARELFIYMKSYIKIFNSNELPPPTSILKATAEAGLLTAYQEAMQLYVDHMTNECGEKELSVPPEDVKLLHDWYKNEALTGFTKKKKIGPVNDANKKKEKLSKDIDKRRDDFALINKAKEDRVKKSAEEAYDAEITKVRNGKQFCVHSTDVEKIHSKALDVCMRIFDAARKRYSNKPDEERIKFKQSMDQPKYTFLKIENDRNNNFYIDEGGIEYWEYMNQKCSQEPPLSIKKLQEEHELGLAKVKETFRAKRNQKDSYTEDVFISQLTDDISKSFVQIKEINSFQNRRAIMAAISIFDNYMTSKWNKGNECLHEEDLKKELETAVCEAKKAFRPQKACTAGDQSADEEERTLQNTLKTRCTNLEKTNDEANERAISSALQVYRDTVKEREKPNWTWYTVFPAIDHFVNKVSFVYHLEAKQEAIKAFYNQRRYKGNKETDSYLHRLDTACPSSKMPFHQLKEVGGRAFCECPPGYLVDRNKKILHQVLLF